MAKLNDFVGSIAREGLMRTNRFSVMLSIPQAVSRGSYTTDLRKVLLYCDTINIPGISVATTEAKTYGEIREMPYQRLFEPITMTFFVDNSMNVKLLFDAWLAAIIDPGSRIINYYKDYISTMTISIQDINEKSRYQVTAYECYPKSVSSIQMDYASKDVMKVTVTMVSKYWESNSIMQTSQNSSIDKIPNKYFTNFNSFQLGS
jgi:hypothetical protein